MKNKTGRIVVIGIVVAVAAAAIQTSNKNAYKRAIAEQKEYITTVQLFVDDYREKIKNYKTTYKYYYQQAVEELPVYETALEREIPIYEANVEYYNTHWLFLRRPLTQSRYLVFE